MMLPITFILAVLSWYYSCIQLVCWNLVFSTCKLSWIFCKILSSKTKLNQHHHSLSSTFYSTFKCVCVYSQKFTDLEIHYSNWSKFWIVWSVCKIFLPRADLIQFWVYKVTNHSLRHVGSGEFLFFYTTKHFHGWSPWKSNSLSCKIGIQ